MVEKVFIAGNTDAAPEFAATLQATGYSQVGSAADLTDIETQVQRTGADALVVSLARLQATDLQALTSMQLHHPVITVLHLQQADSATTRELAEAGIGSLVVGDLLPPRLPQLLDIARVRLRQLTKLRDQITDLQNSLQERKLVDRAKGLIMGKGKYSEEQAYHALRKLAMNQNRTMADVARGVISSAELFN